MADIVDDFERYADSLGWKFSYGDRQNRNLLESDREEGLVYMLLDPVTRGRAFSINGGEGNQTFSGSFMLVVKSTIDQVYHNQQNSTEPDFLFSKRAKELDGGFIVASDCGFDVVQLGKYIENIKPLLNTEIRKLESLINCGDYAITNWSIIDVINALDVNTDGIIVTYNLTIL